MAEMTEAALESFLAEPRNAILCIAREPGRAPHATPVWFVHAAGRFQISITRTRVKYRLLQRAPEVSLVVDDPATDRAVLVEGHATIADGDAELLALAQAMRAKYGAEGRPPGDAVLLRSLRDEERVVVTVTAERVISWAG